MVVNEDVAAQHFGEGLVAKLALWRISLAFSIPLVPPAAIRFGVDKRRAVSGDVAHAGRYTAIRVGTLGILAAGHLEPVLGSRKFHRLHRASRHDFQDDASPADEIGGSWKHLECRDPASQHARELRVLRPNRVLCPYVWSRGTRRFIPVAERVSPRRSVNAEVGVIIDDSRRHVLAGAVDHDGIGRSVNAYSNGGDFSALQQDRSVSDERAGRRKDVDVSYYRGPRRKWRVSAGERVSIRGGNAAQTDSRGCVARR